MPMFTAQRDLYEQGASPEPTHYFSTIGTVVDTNDPQQMGRVRVVCPQWGDSWESIIEDLPWAIYCSPFGGHSQVGTRGPGLQESEGSVAYGMWAIPQVGAQTVVMCIDGNPMTRMYFGCVYDQFVPHTMPHGRYMYDDHPELQKKGPSPAPFGPYTSSEKLIQPLADNQQEAFGNKSEPNYEYRTRGADYSVSRVDVTQLNQTYSKVQDDKDVKHDGWTNTQGYQTSRTDPHGTSSYTDRNYDSMIYSITSPGFHAFAMDDRQENCRMRIRTSGGHQIILDDTNERIYIATAKGKSWIEMDQDGAIDVYSATKINLRSMSDVNVTSDDTVRIYGKKGVHIKADEEIRFDAGKDIHLKTSQKIHVHAGDTLFLTSSKELHAKAGTALFATAGDELNLKCGSDMKLTTAANMNLLSGTQVLLTAPIFHQNGPTAAEAGEAKQATEQPAFWTSRVPDHEPWARTSTKDNNTHDPEVAYTSSDVGRIDRGRTITRGTFWRR